MARTAIPVSLLPGTTSGAYLNASLVGGDDTNEHEWSLKAGDIVVIFNTDSSGGKAADLQAVPNGRQNRTQDTNEDILAGDMAVIGPLQLDGWAQPAGEMFLNTDDGSGVLKFAVLRKSKR